MKRKCLYLFGALLFLVPFLFSLFENHEQQVWESFYISKIISFSDLEKISIKESGFLQSKTYEITARISEDKNLDEVIENLKSMEFTDIEETNENLTCVHNKFDPYFNTPAYICISKKTRSIFIYYFHC